MSLTHKEYLEIWLRLRTIQKVNHKVWKSRHYKWANSINWEVQMIKKMIESVIGQME